ncbi:unnamed protein product [Microthlaspi erraticum]|uniref:DDE Tnp4 domain-containing protein n=1 Tax=Microthlaspi erraticum TaxID=1685480 RepID=A0A6D2HMP2_9BRAS|nr:unnamed protein product [Microthlaspi erraticum]
MVSYKRFRALHRHTIQLREDMAACERELMDAEQGSLDCGDASRESDREMAECIEHLKDTSAKMGEKWEVVKESLLLAHTGWYWKGSDRLTKMHGRHSYAAYGNAADAVDEYLRLGASTALKCLHKFTNAIIGFYEEDYLRRPTPADLKRLLKVGETRGFPGSIGSIDCTLNDINVLHRSPVFDDILEGRAPKVSFSVNGHRYKKAYYLTDEVERAFGVLQARFAIVKNPSLTMDKEKIGNIMKACIILHNMIVEDERDAETIDNVTEFQQGGADGSGSSRVRPPDRLPSNVHNIMANRADIRDQQKHHQLKADLVEHIWNKFGH